MSKTQGANRMLHTMKKVIAYYGKITITTTDSFITNVKSISILEDGIYYSKRTNAQSFSQSLPIEDFKGFIGHGLWGSKYVGCILNSRKNRV